MRRDIDDSLQGWPYDPRGATMAREIRARDGRLVVQVRQELGMLQMEVEGRPDGQRPHGFRSYLEYLRYRAADRSVHPARSAPALVMSEEHCQEVDREVVQYYHRRMAWLSLQRYERMLTDAEHTLAIMDFVSRHSDDEQYVMSHERFRGLVLFHKTQARAALGLERRRPEEAIDAVREGAEQIRVHQEGWLDHHNDEAETPNDALLEQLARIEDEIRRSFDVGKTLREQLEEAIAQEDYERAARLRDALRIRQVR